MSNQKQEKTKTQKKQKEASSTKKESNSSLNEIPEKLKVYVSQEIWDKWSPIRRESFTQIIKNPNAFFYRNRPPGDPQKYGPFTNEEEAQFLERLKYFRDELNVNDGLWGLFSIPIRGRVGYQCSNFYRLLIKNKKVEDDHYEVQEDGKLKFLHGNKSSISAEVIKKLENEAFLFIKQCLQTEDGVVPTVSEPIIVGPENNSNTTQTTKPFKCTRASKEIIKYLGHQRSIQQKKSIQQPISLGAKKFSSGGTIHSFSEENNRFICPIFGAIDPLSNEPIDTPMMDSNGYVMDLKSWRRVFRHNETPPCQMVAKDESDLIELNSKNFNEFRLQILNIVC